MTKNQTVKCFCDYISVDSMCVGVDFLQKKLTDEQATEKLKNIISKIERAISEIEKDK
jgi:microsomal dipeptidase-like Zn-dependent dipeptidase